MNVPHISQVSEDVIHEATIAASIKTYEEEVKAKGSLEEYEQEQLEAVLAASMEDLSVNSTAAPDIKSEQDAPDVTMATEAQDSPEVSGSSAPAAAPPSPSKLADIKMVQDFQAGGSQFSFGASQRVWKVEVPCPGLTALSSSQDPKPAPPVAPPISVRPQAGKTFQKRQVEASSPSMPSS